MGWLRRVTNVWRGRELDDELDRELTFHLQERVDELVAGGMKEAEAWRAARRKFGNYTLEKERTREMDVARWLEAALADLRYGVRQLRLNPGFASVAILSLALGIGANTAIFQLIDAIRMRSLPVSRPWELAMVDRAPRFFTAGSYRARNTAFTYSQYRALQAQTHAFSGLLAFGTDRFKLNEGGEARYAEGIYVSPNFFEVLGVAPLVGTTFGPEQMRPDCGGGAAVVSYSFWQRELGGDAKVVGRLIRLNGRMTPVVGVMPQDFFGLEPERRFDIAVPLCQDNLYVRAADGEGFLYRTDGWWLTLIGRLRPGWSLERAGAEIRDISQRIFRETVPESYAADMAKAYLKNTFILRSASAGVSSLRREYEDPLWILLGTSALVLLIACANLANLLLARASVREREIAVRQAIGASGARVVGQMLVESLLLAVLGAGLGAGLAEGLSRALGSLLEAENEQVILNLHADWRVFAFTAGLALVTCLLFGLAPALRVSGFAPAALMRAGGRGTTGGREWNRLRRTLVVAQVALSLILLAAAMMFGRSMRNLMTAPTGMKTDGLLVAGIDASLLTQNKAERPELFERVRERIGAVPGVAQAGTVSIAPFSGNSWNDFVRADGSASKPKLSWFNAASPGYFGAVGTRIVAGRDFTAHDAMGAPRVAIVNRQLAAALFGGKNPVGRAFRVAGLKNQPDRVYEIAGVVENSKYLELREATRSIAWVPLDQDEDPGDSASVMIRTRGAMGPVVTGVKRAVAEVSPELSLNFRVMADQIAQSAVRDRMMANVAGGFGLLAALLSTLGLYGVMSYMVARRRNEIGVRMALGARRANVEGMVMREAGALLGVGVVVGLGGALALGRYAESLLYELKANDPLTLALAVVLLACAGLLASLVPARRAARLDPMAALREE